MKRTNRYLCRMTAAMLSCLMLPAMPVLAAEEEIDKTFLYYHSLSDFEVYQEYCELYGFEAEETLPEETALPDYEYLRHYTTSGVFGIVFYVYCKEEVPYEINTTPEMFGLPAEWYEHELIDTTEEGEMYTYRPVVQLFETGGIATTEKGTECTYYEIRYTMPNVKNYVPDYVQGSYEDSIVDIYRVRLSLHHSDFVAQYACLEDDINVSPVVQYYTISGGVDSIPEVYGDFNGDLQVDASDAAILLEYAAAAGAGNVQSLEEYLEEKYN